MIGIIAQLHLTQPESICLKEIARSRYLRLKAHWISRAESTTSEGTTQSSN
jgi:hypothetical protein